MSRYSTRVSYEWDYETFDEHGDIYDHEFSDNFPGIPNGDDLPEGCAGVNLVLVRDVLKGWSDDFNATADLHERTWCYVEDGKLPSHFSDSMGNEIHPVPKRFARHFSG